MIERLELGAEKLLGPMALLARIAGRPEILDRSRDRLGVFVGEHGIELMRSRDFGAHIPGRTAADMTLHAAHASMWRTPVRGVFRAHDLVTHRPTKGVGLGEVIRLIAADHAGGDEYDYSGERAGHDEPRLANVEINTWILSDILRGSQPAPPSLQEQSTDVDEDPERENRRGH